jgi:hypothetical protein
MINIIKLTAPNIFDNNDSRFLGIALTILTASETDGIKKANFKNK